MYFVHLYGNTFKTDVNLRNYQGLGSTSHCPNLLEMFSTFKTINTSDGETYILKLYKDYCPTLREILSGHRIVRLEFASFLLEQQVITAYHQTGRKRRYKTLVKGTARDFTHWVEGTIRFVDAERGRIHGRKSNSNSS